jgi:hypothetical protein
MLKKTNDEEICYMLKFLKKKKPGLKYLILFINVSIKIRYMLKFLKI